MIKTEFQLLMAGAGTLLAAFAMGSGLGATEPVHAANGTETVMASYVETAQQARPAAAPLTSSEILPDADGLYYIHAHMPGGKRMRFLIDTGASVTVLTARDAAAMGLHKNVSAKGATLRTAGGTTTARSTKIDSMTIAGRDLRNIDAAIIDNGLPVSLLGQNALSELGTITLGNGRMIIG